MERVEADDYKKLTLETTVTPLPDASDLQNSAIVRTRELGDHDIEYEGYWLQDENTLYIVEGDDKQSVINRLTLIMNNPKLGFKNRYLLSVKK
ncbi:MAG: hypothetical protein ACRCV0_03910 [Brevinema sp.]